MIRRNFLEHSSRTAAGLILLPLISCKKGFQSDSISIEEITINQIHKHLKDGSLTIIGLVKTYLKRIEDIDRSGPALNSVITINPGALKLANTLDDEYQRGQIRGPLHGIPVLLKDNIDTFDMATTAGSRALKESIPSQDSPVAQKLRKAGAIILGKANLSEWANFRGQRSTSGWSGHGGLTKNPYILDRNGCGSSTGPGVSVSANLCVLAIGTETNGSIVCPSTTNGIVGIKPTVGLISRSGIVPISFTQDTAGPMARTVTDAAICLGTLTGIDPSDAKTTESKGHLHTDYTEFLRLDGLDGKKLAHLTSSRGRHKKVDAVMERALADLKEKGAEIIEIDRISDPGVSKNSFEVMLYEYKDGLNKYFTSLGPTSPVTSIEDLIAFNEGDSLELKYFGQEYLIQASEKGDLNSPEYKEALQKMLTGRREEGIDKVMDENGLDAIIAPTGGPAWKTDLVNGDSFSLGSSSPAAQAGYPNITVPMGFIEELPVGISFFGRAWSEPVLIEIAYAFEQATHHRQAPKFLKS